MEIYPLAHWACFLPSDLVFCHPTSGSSSGLAEPMTTARATLSMLNIQLTCTSFTFGHFVDQMGLQGGSLNHLKMSSDVRIDNSTLSIYLTTSATMAVSLFVEREPATPTTLCSTASAPDLERISAEKPVAVDLEHYLAPVLHKGVKTALRQPVGRWTKFRVWYNLYRQVSTSHLTGVI